VSQTSEPGDEQPEVDDAPEGAAEPTAAKTPLYKRRKTWLWTAVAVVAAWFLVTVGLTAFHAQQANKAINAMVDQIAAGDPDAAQGSIDEARAATKAAQSDVNGLPLAALRIVPYFNTNLKGVDSFLTGALSVLDGAEVANQLYADLSGEDGGTGVFENGRINIKAVKDMQPQVEQISADLTAAQAAIDEMPADISPVLRQVSDKATEQIEGIQKGMRIYESLRPDLPQLLGADSPQTYLVVFHNPAELYAGGGASLNAALLQFDNGKMKVVDKGAVSTHFFPGNPEVPWDPVAGGPYYAESGATDGFAWSNLHQDFRVAGEDMMRSWVANGGQPVDGVISLDPVALAAAVEATGPIESELYGEITADNLVEKLFYEGYSEDWAAQAKRHEINQQLIEEMLARMQDGGAALSIARAMFSTAPGQHIRIYLSDGREEKALREAEADGAQPAEEPDRIAFYTQNQNASKVDIFQTRSIVHDVTLNADGSASVTQTATVTNNAPENDTPLSQRLGYTTRWAFHWNIALLPEDAKNIEIGANEGEVKTDKKVYTDVDGRKAVRVGRWIPPGESTVVTLTYDLPAGTFGADGNLEYRASVEHQLLINEATLTVTVRGPSQPTPLEGDWTVQGNDANTTFIVTRPTTIALGYGDRA
jgi:hypothetical protein